MKIKLLTTLVLIVSLVAGSALASLSFIGSKVEYSLHGVVTPEMAEEFRLFMRDRSRWDEITIHIDSPGGRVDAMNKMIHYLEKYHDYRITCIVDRYAASAAAVIALLCPKKEIAQHAALVLHVIQVCEEFTGISCSKMTPVSFANYPEEYKESVYLLNKCCSRYLTSDQWDRLMDGEDVLIHGRQVNRKIQDLGE